MTWQLVPLKPNELTPARLGLPSRLFHSLSSVLMKKGLPSKSICGLTSSMLMVGGICWYFMASKTLKTPPTPAEPIV